jgi:hypothetical protein
MAGIGVKDAGQQLDQAALACAIGSQDAKKLARSDIEIKSLQDGGLARVGELQSSNVDRRIHGCTGGWARVRTRVRTLPK